MDIKETLKKLVTVRANRIPAWDIAFILDNDDFRVAGGCFMDEVPNDYDVYPAFGKLFNAVHIRKNTIESKGEVICETNNAITVKVHGKVIQFCTYYKATLQELVDSFDFSHCQVGVEFSPRETEDGGIATPEIKDIAWFDAWVEYRITRQSTYTGSEYPLSSLIRLNKYVKRDIIKGKSYTIEVLKILNDIIKRGYTDYRDFKNQLDAVDLLLLEPKEANAAYELFKNLSHCTPCADAVSTEVIDNGQLDVLEETDNGLW